MSDRRDAPDCISLSQLSVQYPSMPNYLRLEGSDACVSIADFSDADLRAVGKAWTDALVDCAASIRRGRSAR